MVQQEADPLLNGDEADGMKTPMPNRFVQVFYDQIAADPKFDTIRDDNATMGLWLRLLMLADPLWPQPSPVPYGTPDALLNELAGRGIIEVLPDRRFRFHGLSSERARRSEKASHAANVRWGNEDAVASVEHNAKAMPRVSSSSTSVNDDRVGEEVESPADGPIAYMEVMGKGCSRGSNSWDWAARLAKQYGAAGFRQSLAEEAAIDRSPSTILGRTERRLQLKVAKAVKAEPQAEDWLTKERARRKAMDEADAAG